MTFEAKKHRIAFSMSFLRWLGVFFLFLALLSLLAYLFGYLPWAKGSAPIVLIFASSALGACLLFISRYLSRPEGIDNDAVYHSQITAKGFFAWALALILTSFYVVIYLGNDIAIGETQEGRIFFNEAGRAVRIEGGFLKKAIMRLCPDCKQGEWRNKSHTSFWPQSKSFQKRLAEALDKPSKFRKDLPVKEAHLNEDYFYRLSLIIEESAPAHVAVLVKREDTLHHLFTRHVYPLLDPIAYALSGAPSSNWFFYSSLYTFALCIFAFRMLLKYRHNRYQIWRTLSVFVFQLGFAYILPNVLRLFHQPEFYFSYFWPLKVEYLYPQYWYAQYGAGVYFLIFAALMSFVGTPVLTYFYGKRWYCSWVCGCGGLAETMGDPFRQHSSKSLSSWKIERWMVHSILGFIILITALLWINSVSKGALFASFSYKLQKAYGFFIGAVFSGVIGVGFYPLLGSRVWCRFGCPMAAVLGILQKYFSRFRITTNGGQCISCGNCSTYCEMGIDVRWYAQRSQNIARASCVGCGICAAVCPRGVLKLENGPLDNKYVEAKM